jgi:hypothetical protein
LTKRSDLTSHQLLIHVGLEIGTGDVLVVYSYPFSQPHELREQTIRIAKGEIPEAVEKELGSIVQALVKRIPPPDLVRMPHAEIEPQIRYASATIVIQDKRRRDLLLAVMYYLELIPESSSQVERQVRIERDDFSDDESASWKRLRQTVKAIVWADYKNRFGHYFRD